MADGVLLDTSFLITLVDPTQPQHAVAVQYFKYFAREGVPMFLSTIVAAEFGQKQPVTDLPLDAMIVLPFNLTDAQCAAALDFTQYKGTPDVPRVALKDDFKLLGQVKANDLGFVITEDARTLYKFCVELRTKHQLAARAIKLVDGFDRSHFDPAGQHDFEGKLEEPPGQYAAAPLLEPTGEPAVVPPAL